MKKNIVIIGGGYAGIITAKKLAKRLKRTGEITITVIDKNPFHTMLTELHEVAANRVDEENIRVSFHKVFAERRVDIKHDSVKSIDFENRLVIGEKEEYSYDYLVIAAGSRPAFYGIDGAKEHTFKLWSYEDAVILRDHIHNSFRKATHETDLEKKKQLLSFFVVGAGFTGVEMAGELAEYIPILCKQLEIDRSLVSLSIVDLLTRCVPILPDKLSDKVERRLVKMGVNIMLGTNVVSINEEFIHLEKNGNSFKQNAGTVIWAAGIESSQITQEASKALQSEKGGRIKVNSFLQSLDNENVYVIGDNMFYIPDGENMPVPQMVENSEQSAETATHNIICAVSGGENFLEYKPTFHGMMVSVGGRYGVARVGFPKRMVNLPSFLAMFVKHFINVVYFVQILGWHKVFNYIKHEFFTIRNCRSFVGGHFSNRTPSFLLIPLRVWLGIAWVYEGIMKIYEGWFESAKLKPFFGGADAWYDSILYGTTGAFEAVSAATEEAVAKNTGTLIFNWNFGVFRAIFVSANELIHSTIGDYAFKLEVPFARWFIDKYILSQNFTQVNMQIIIVTAEILIGLALIGGLFTFFAALFSLVLQVMFVSTTGLYLSTFWMIFAAIALLIGAGRTIGLDYYVIPYLEKKWKKLRFVRKLYLYND